jgi:hypothetical protein
MDQIKPESLDWSLTHISRFGDTDIFPVPFEYDAIRHCWTGIKNWIAKVDLESYECRSLRRFLIPKPQGGYRVAIQLDPIDTLIYTALVYEAAELIEQQRMPLERRIACSYRIEIDSKGQFFRAKNGWNDYHDVSLELAESGNYEYVVSADVADFYNQISHHRVRNALESAGVTSDRAKNVENFLMNLTGGQSRGIPVGPSGSILLAEACLSDVDSFLLRKGYIHTRYVDDFRIFCATRTEAYQALHDLSEYLYTSHRLALQSSKTRAIPIEDFINHEILDPERLENQSKTNKINEILLMLSYYVGYGGEVEYQEIAEDDLSPDELRDIVRENLIELFDACLSKQPLKLGLARYLLRRATRLETAVLQDRVLGNLETLAPVMRDVATYLLKTTRSNTATKVGEALIHFTQTSDLAFMSFLRLWALHILVEKLAFEFEQPVSKICRSVRNQLGVRPFALLARNLRYLDWVRAQKETWQNNGPWDRRAVIWAATAMSEDERGFWLKRVQNAGDILDNAVAKAALSGI